MSPRLMAPIASLAMAAACLVAAIGLLGAIDGMQERACSTPPSPNAPESAAASEDDGFPKVDWDHWKDVNPDVIGWITIPETPIDYPIVQAPKEDPDHYLSHDVTGAPNYLGAVYLDAECADEGLFGCRNAVVFAHHFAHDPSMFASMAKYGDEDFMAEHPLILLQTPDEKRAVKVLGARIIPGSAPEKRTSFEGDADFQAYLAESLQACGAEKAPGGVADGQMLTFVTCSYEIWQDNERTLVYGAFASK